MGDGKSSISQLYNTDNRVNSQDIHTLDRTKITIRGNILNGDLNDYRQKEYRYGEKYLPDAGWWFAAGEVKNRPDVSGGGFVEVLDTPEQWGVVQRFTHNDTQRTYTRVAMNGQWTPWKGLCFQSELADETSARKAADKSLENAYKAADTTLKNTVVNSTPLLRLNDTQKYIKDNVYIYAPVSKPAAVGDITVADGYSRLPTWTPYLTHAALNYTEQDYKLGLIINLPIGEACLITSTDGKPVVLYGVNHESSLLTENFEIISFDTALIQVYGNAVYTYSSSTQSLTLPINALMIGAEQYGKDGKYKTLINYPPASGTGDSWNYGANGVCATMSSQTWRPSPWNLGSVTGTHSYKIVASANARIRLV